MFLRLIYLKKFNFSQCQNNCWHTDWCQEWNIMYNVCICTWPLPIGAFQDQCKQTTANIKTSLHITVSQLKCVSDTISSWFENHQPQKTKISTVIFAKHTPRVNKGLIYFVIYAPFIQNSNQMASRLTAATSFPRVLFSTPVIFKAASKPFGSQGCSDDKNWLDFPSIFFKICRFHSSILFRCKFSFHKDSVTLESGLTVAWFFPTNHNSLLRIATNEIASFFIDHRSRQMAFFRAKAGQRRGKRLVFALCWNILK